MTKKYKCPKCRSDSLQVTKIVTKVNTYKKGKLVHGAEYMPEIEIDCHRCDYKGEVE